MSVSRRTKRKIPRDVVRLRIALVDVEPPIWRRIEIGIPQDDFSDLAPSITPGWDVPMIVYLNRAGDGAEYVYNFGDNWAHDLIVEGRDAPEPEASYPRCTGGARACPPEDFSPDSVKFTSAKSRLARLLRRE